MKEELFNELIESIREAGKIRRGKQQPSSATRIKSVGAKATRLQFGMPQETFATMLGISKRTLEGWEQGRRQPTGPARRLLEIAAHFPDIIYQIAFGRQVITLGNADGSFTKLTTRSNDFSRPFSVPDNAHMITVPNTPQGGNIFRLPTSTVADAGSSHPGAGFSMDWNQPVKLGQERIA